MRLRTLALFALALGATAAANAQVRQGTFEVSPYAGYFWGGEFSRGTTALFDFDVEADDAPAYGLRLGYNLNSTFQIELQISHVPTEFATKEHDELFGDDSQRSFGDLDIDSALAYMTFNFGHSRAVPYVTLGAGVARLDPGPIEIPIVCVTTPCNPVRVDPDDEIRFTASLGGGIKTFFTPNFGLRFDGRGYATSLGNNDDDDFFCDDDDFFDSCDNDRRDWLTSGEVSVGLIFAF